MDRRALAPGSSVGRHIRERREEAGLTQAALASMLGVTRAQISNLERGVSSPSYKLLLGLKSALGVAVSDLLREEPVELASTVVGPEDRHTVIPPRAHGAHIEQLAPFALGMIDPREVVLQPMSGRMLGRPHVNDEWLLVLEGSLELRIEDETYTLEEGESVYYSGQTSHCWSNISLYPTRLLWVRVTNP
jgi:transcriptional regulator with XRE-family HTH domain